MDERSSRTPARATALPSIPSSEAGRRRVSNFTCNSRLRGRRGPTHAGDVRLGLAPHRRVTRPGQHRRLAGPESTSTPVAVSCDGDPNEGSRGAKSSTRRRRRNRPRPKLPWPTEWRPPTHLTEPSPGSRSTTARPRSASPPGAPCRGDSRGPWRTNRHRQVPDSHCARAALESALARGVAMNEQLQPTRTEYANSCRDARPGDSPTAHGRHCRGRGSGTRATEGLAMAGSGSRRRVWRRRDVRSPWIAS